MGTKPPWFDSFNSRSVRAILSIGSYRESRERGYSKPFEFSLTNEGIRYWNRVFRDEIPFSDYGLRLVRMLDTWEAFREDN
jgi:hypothetical protein